MYAVLVACGYNVTCGNAVFQYCCINMLCDDMLWLCCAAVQLCNAVIPPKQLAYVYNLWLKVKAVDLATVGARRDLTRVEKHLNGLFHPVLKIQGKQLKCEINELDDAVLSFAQHKKHRHRHLSHDLTEATARPPRLS